MSKCQSWDSQMIDGVFPTEAKDIDVDISKPKDGGYCPMCDTVWASPGKCKCEENNKNVEIKNVPVEIANDIWNAAIEACLKIWDDIGPNETDKDIDDRIRKLKR